MTKTETFSMQRRLKSFAYAVAGFTQFFRTEHNARIHAFATVLVIPLSLMMNISSIEWIAIVFAIALVWITEMINTAIEKTMDHLAPQLHPQVKLIKDVAAAAVLTASVAASIIALIIYIPKLL